MCNVYSFEPTNLNNTHGQLPNSKSWRRTTVHMVYRRHNIACGVCRTKAMQGNVFSHWDNRKKSGKVLPYFQERITSAHPFLVVLPKTKRMGHVTRCGNILLNRASFHFAKKRGAASTKYAERPNWIHPTESVQTQYIPAVQEEKIACMQCSCFLSKKKRKEKIACK